MIGNAFLNQNRRKPFGNHGVAALLLWMFSTGIATVGWSAEFKASVDQNVIGQDESVSLQMVIEMDGNEGRQISEPTFSAPDFDILNSFTSSFMHSFYENGKFGVRNSQKITKVLRPQKTGKLTITGIQVTVDGKQYQAPAIEIEVTPGGAGTPPSRYTQRGRMGLRGGGQPAPDSKKFFVRAELNKSELYKGEQLIVSYYFYRSSPTPQVQPTKYPSLNGFLKEDLEMPIQQGLNPEVVLFNGARYEKALLARYAAYPVKEGELKIDPFGLKYTYFPVGRGDDLDDPFNSFFQQFNPRVGSRQSDVVKVKVKPLPAAGKPDSFTGGVGAFDVASTVDRYEVHANESVTLTVRVEGRGNVNAIQAPDAKWPESVELYESKGRAKVGQGGVGQKIFEYLFIPRQPGEITLPRLEFSFFDPEKGEYATRFTQPISIRVTDPLPGSPLVQLRKKNEGNAETDVTSSPDASTPPPELRLFKSATDWNKAIVPPWTWFYWLQFAGILVFGGFVGFRNIFRFGRRLKRRSETSEQGWKSLEKTSEEIVRSGTRARLAEAYEQLAQLILTALEESRRVGAFSLSRAELKRIFVQGDHPLLTLKDWQQLEQMLDFSETFRFAGESIPGSEEKARQMLVPWVAQAQEITQKLIKKG